MQYTIIRWLNLGSLFFVMLSFHLDTAIVRFLLVGELPGSEAIVSPNTAIALYIILAALFISYLVLTNATRPSSAKRATPFRPKLPTKRFTSL